jgi:hypothetical protein
MPHLSQDPRVHRRARLPEIRDKPIDGAGPSLRAFNLIVMYHTPASSKNNQGAGDMSACPVSDLDGNTPGST